MTATTIASRPMTESETTNINFWLPAEHKRKFSQLCAVKGTTMTEELKAYIARQLEENTELLELIEKHTK